MKAEGAVEIGGFDEGGEGLGEGCGVDEVDCWGVSGGGGGGELVVAGHILVVSWVSWRSCLLM